MKSLTVVLAACAVLGGSTFARAQQASTPSRAAKPAPSAQGFNVVLVLADLEAGPATPDNVPIAARKALADMKDFLPYKSYKLLDTAWILSANDSTNATSRLRGLDERTYELMLTATAESSVSVSDRSLRVSFRLRDSSLREVSTVHETSPTPTLDYLHSQLEKDAQRRAERESGGRKEAEGTAQTPQQARERMNETIKEVGRIMELRALDARTGAEIRSRIAVPSSPVIDTGFTMDIGETVVVGTSRVRGDKAIIALLTAVPRSGRK